MKDGFSNCHRVTAPVKEHTCLYSDVGMLPEGGLPLGGPDSEKGPA